MFLITSENKPNNMKIIKRNIYNKVVHIWMYCSLINKLTIIDTLMAEQIVSWLTINVQDAPLEK